MRIIDISVGLKNGMAHWPGDPAVKIKRVKDIAKGDSCNLSQLSMGVHTATHMDAPLHFLSKGKSLDQMPMSAVIGPVKVIEIKDKGSIKEEELKKHKIYRGQRILFKTKNSRYWKTKKFKKDFVYLSYDAARYLVKKGIRIVGVDYFSVGGFHKDGAKIHQTLLRGGIWIIEGLDLSRVKAGKYNLTCLPLKILNSDGAPARAILSRAGKGS